MKKKCTDARRKQGRPQNRLMNVVKEDTPRVGMTQVDVIWV